MNEVKMWALVALIGAGINVHGQGALQFEKVNHDFGLIQESEGPADFTFRFVNMGTDSLRITEVKPSCGCTTPDWTRKMVAPGDSGFVTASFNPYNRPGAFSKILRVRSSDGAQKVLNISGTVQPRPRTIADDLPTLMGAIRTKYRSFNFGKITTEQPVTRRFDIYNAGEVPVAIIASQTQKPGHIEVDYETDTLETQTRSSIRITYDPSLNAELGFNSDQMMIVTSDSLMPEKRFSVVATVEEYFPPMTEEELKQSPTLVFSADKLDFGQISSQSLSSEVVLKNDGRTPLRIRSVKPTCPCVKVELPEMEIAPGSSVSMKVTFDPKGRRGRQYKTITVFSNDPKAPTQVVSVRADLRQ